MIKVKTKRKGSNTEQYLLKIRKGFNEEQIRIIAEKSLEKFKENTPSKSGLTAESWFYTYYKEGDNWVINFENNNIQNGMNVALLIENGHATPSGKWVSGKHFIEQTVKEINNDILNNEWKELTKDE